MRRWFLTIPAFLLLGAVVNVAVAWGCALRADFQSPKRIMSWPVLIPARWTDGHLRASSDLGVTEVYALRIRTDCLPHQYVFAAGFPTRCLYLKAHRVTTGCIAPPRGGSNSMLPWNWEPDSWRDGLKVPAAWSWLSRRGRMCFLPTEPIWPSFAINTLFYASTLWLLIPGPFVLRRFLRLRRGLCPKCAYPMGESSVCTECGGLLPPQLVSAP